METEEIVWKNPNGFPYSVKVTPWFRGDQHPHHDGWYPFLMYGSAPDAVHYREYRNGAWRSLNNPEAKFNALPLDRWRGAVEKIEA